MIYSQLIKDVETAVVMNNIQFDTMKNRVKSGGLLILEADDYAENIERKDIQVIKVPGIKISSKIANPRVINTVYLGVYIGATKTVPHELVKTELEKRFEGKNEILKMNLEAFKEGVNFGEAA
jgi:2-oxoglutarate ferredoxin oxidoreductase subunit gamma